jgi:prophage antirepressor-like protein
MLLTIGTEKYISELLNIEIEIYREEGSQNFWFHGASICDVFGFKNPTLTIQRHVDEDWRKQVPQSKGRDAWFVAEPGFYQLLHASKHPAAKRFQRWVYSEVLPKLRAEGGYIMPSATLEQVLALASYHEQRLNDFISGAKRYEDMWMLYNRPGLMLIAQKELVEPKYSTEEKEANE